MRKRATPRETFDAPWKKIVQRHYPKFIAFFAPAAYDQIDWSHDPEFLDKELRRVSRGLKRGLVIADFLVKVWLKDGEEHRILSHIELQAQKDEAFPERMFLYNVRSYDLYRYKIHSLAILADDDPNWRPSSFHYEQFDSRTLFEFPTVKLLDYSNRQAELESSDNPFALAVLAHLKTLETRGDADARSIWKLRLIRMLRNRGWLREEMESLFEFIDWIMALPEDLEDHFEAELVKLEEEDKTMAELMSPRERRHTERGRKIGLQEGILASILTMLEYRFGDIDESLEIRLRKIEDKKMLNQLLISSHSSATLEDFERSLDS